ncbi:MAG: hypothetical protein U0R71_06600 [Solirubrobacterales bacterium]
MPPLASMLPLAHLGHWLWVFYVIPVLIVVAGIALSSRSQKRRGGDDPPAGGAGGDPEHGGEAPAGRDPPR